MGSGSKHKKSGHGGAKAKGKKSKHDGGHHGHQSHGPTVGGASS
jgi:hypothetical protein